MKGTGSNKLLTIVGFLVVVEIASGIIQGYYTPLYTDIARRLGIHDADVNWFEAAQLVVSALVVPALARLGDLVGHQRILLASTGVTAAAAWAVAFAPNFWTYLISWALMGPYVVWLPIEIAIVHRRTGGDPRRTRSAAAALVFSLEFGVIAGALGSGALSSSLGMTELLMVPPAVITLCFFAVLFGVPHEPPTAHGRFDGVGLAWITAALLAVMGGLLLIRVLGVASVWPWLLLLAGGLLAVRFVRHELGTGEPLLDIRVLRAPAQWPVQLTSALFGVSVLGAQIPLSTFVRTDPDTAGYGLGASAGGVSLLIGGYVLMLAIGAALLPLAVKLLGERTAMVGGACAIAVGYALFLVNHSSIAGCLANMAVVGLGSGILMAALPSAAAAAAPPTHTAQVAGLTNMSKTVGGAFASSTFALCLAATGSLSDPTEGHAPFGGYLAVWCICAATAALAAAALTRMPLRQGAAD